MSYEASQRHSDEWALREKLALVSCVRRVGRDSWSAVARMMRNIVEPGRPPHFFSAGRCALKFAELNGAGDNKKRESKKNSRWSIDEADGNASVNARRSTVGGTMNFSLSASGMSDEQLLEDRLRQERIAELRAQLAETHRRFNERTRLLTDLESGKVDAETLRKLQLEMIAAERDLARQNGARRNEASQTTEARAEAPPITDMSTSVADVRSEPESDQVRSADSDTAPVSAEPILMPAEVTTAEQTEIKSTEQDDSKQVIEAKPKIASVRFSTTINSTSNTISNSNALRVEPVHAAGMDTVKIHTSVVPEISMTPKRSAETPASKSDLAALPTAASVSSSSSPGSTRSSLPQQQPQSSAVVTASLSPGITQKTPSSVQSSATTGEQQSAGQTAPIKLTLKLSRNTDMLLTAVPTQSAVTQSNTSTPVATTSAMDFTSPNRLPAATELSSTKNSDKASANTIVLTNTGRTDPPVASETVATTKLSASTRQIASKSGSTSKADNSDVMSSNISTTAVTQVAAGGERDDGWAVQGQEPSISLGSSAADREQRARFKKLSLEALRHVGTHKHALIFQKPVTADQAPGYSSAVLAPADLTSTRRRVEQAAIGSFEQLLATIRRMFINAVMFNRRDDRYFAVAIEMHDDVLPHLEQHQHFSLATELLPPVTGSSLLDLAVSLSSTLMSPSANNSAAGSPASAAAVASKSLRAAASKKPAVPAGATITALNASVTGCDARAVSSVGSNSSLPVAASDDLYPSYTLILRRRRAELLAAASNAIVATISADAPASAPAPSSRTDRENSAVQSSDTTAAARRTRKRVRSRSSTSTTELDLSNGDKPEGDVQLEKQPVTSASTASNKVNNKQLQQQQPKTNESRSSSSSVKKRRK